MTTTSVPVAEHRNEVRLVGRVAAEPSVTMLPSGDELVTARLVVQRPRPPAGRGKRRQVDTVMCAAWSSLLRRRLRIWNPGDTVEVTGALRRRFWRGESGSRSRFEIEVATACRLARAPVPASEEDET
ncbi:single-strand DNA-binding protein [Haloactinopolyspora alba]|uniref:Single-strand DNA-binding protein n=1 Tax=Haloactinopolyspora alba TaxID=648780 RepID=A0A2P8E226_9ACTN|nr:single-stranded DNA-binding protein [Haloactinopolyspora alba]PSL03524.1 single-strand DNA-binding protein [Haloactinopolyspora alba]